MRRSILPHRSGSNCPRGFPTSREIGSDLEAIIDRLLPDGDGPLARLRASAPRALDVIGHQATIAELSDEVRRQIALPDVPLTAPFVRLMSLHKSKGLTARTVVIAGMVEGLIPRIPDDDLSAELLREHAHEQRRILFVGLTRCTETLVLSSFQKVELRQAQRGKVVTGRWVGRGTKLAMASSLMDELGPSRGDPVRGEDWYY